MSLLKPWSTDCISVFTAAICCAVISCTCSAIMMFVQSSWMLSSVGRSPSDADRIRSTFAIIPSTMFRISVVAISVAVLTLSSWLEAFGSFSAVASTEDLEIFHHRDDVAHEGNDIFQEGDGPLREDQQRLELLHLAQQQLQIIRIHTLLP